MGHPGTSSGSIITELMSLSVMIYTCEQEVLLSQYSGTSRNIKCQATLGDELAINITKQLNKDNNTTGEKIKVVEEGRAPAIASVKRTNTFRTPGYRF